MEEHSMKKVFLILFALGLMLCGAAAAENLQGEYVDLGDSGLQILIPSSLQPAVPEKPDDILYCYEIPGTSHRINLYSKTAVNSMSTLLEFLLDNEYSLISLECTDCGGAPFLIWQMETDGLNALRAYAVFGADPKHTLDMCFYGMEDAAFADLARGMMSSIRQSPTASAKVTFETADEKLAKRLEVQTSGGYGYRLDNNGEAMLVSLPVPEPGETIMLIPRTVDGYPVDTIDALAVPEQIRQVLVPTTAHIVSNKKLTHEILEIFYCDYEQVLEYDENKSPWVFAGPDDLVLTGTPKRLLAGGEREDLVQDYYLYPTSVGGKRILKALSSKYYTLYTGGPYTYYKITPDTIGICDCKDKEAKKIKVPDTVDGLTVTAIDCLYDYTLPVLGGTNTTEIILPSTLKLLGKNAIDAGKMKSLNLPEGLEVIEDNAISVWSLKKITLPSTLRKIGTWFMHVNITKLEIPDGVTEISPYAMKMVFPQSVTLPAGLTEIPGKLFEASSRLKTVSFPAGLTSIGPSAFQACRKLKEVKAGGTALKVIGDYAFSECDALSKLELPEGLEEIGSHAFSECKKLSKVTLPSSLKTIGANAFNGCKALKQITLGGNLESIDPSAFTECAKKLTIIAPKGSYAEEFAAGHGYAFKPAK